MKTKFQTASLLAVAILSASAVAVQQGLTVKRIAKEGQTYKYKMQGTADLGQATIDITANVQEKVGKVEANGDYVLEQTTLDGKIKAGDFEQDLPASTVQTTYKQSNEVSALGESDDPARAMRMANLGLIMDPGKELKVGDKWSHEIKANTSTGAVAAKAEYELLGEEKVEGVDTIKVKSEVKETEGDTPATASSIAWLDKKDGSPVKVETSFTNPPFPGTPIPVLKATVKLNRIG